MKSYRIGKTNRPRSFPWNSSGSRYRSKNKMKKTKELIRKIIRTAERELGKKADVYFTCLPIKSGTSIIHLTLLIKLRRNREQENHINMQLREQVGNILRIRFGFKDEHFQQIRLWMENTDSLRALNEKVGYLWQYLNNHPGKVSNIPLWTVSGTRKLFEGAPDHGKQII